MSNASDDVDSWDKNNVAGIALQVEIISLTGGQTIDINVVSDIISKFTDLHEARKQLVKLYPVLSDDKEYLLLRGRLILLNHISMMRNNPEGLVTLSLYMLRGYDDRRITWSVVEYLNLLFNLYFEVLGQVERDASLCEKEGKE